MHVGSGTFFQNLGNARPGRGRLRARALDGRPRASRSGSTPSGPRSTTSPTTRCAPIRPSSSPGSRAARSACSSGRMVMVLPWHDPGAHRRALHGARPHVAGPDDPRHRPRARARGVPGLPHRRWASRAGASSSTAAAILRALETGWIEYDGEFYKQPRAAIRPGPFRSWKGRVYASSVSPESSAHHGEARRRRHDHRSEALGQDDRRPRRVPRRLSRGERGGAAEAAPRELHGRARGRGDGAARCTSGYIVRYCASTMGHYEFDNVKLADIPGYEYYAGLAPNIEKHGRDKFSHFLAELQVWGTPDQVVEQMIENNRRIGGAGVIGIFSYGSHAARAREGEHPAVRGEGAPAPEGARRAVDARRHDRARRRDLRRPAKRTPTSTAGTATAAASCGARTRSTASRPRGSIAVLGGHPARRHRRGRAPARALLEHDGVRAASVGRRRAAARRGRRPQDPHPHGRRRAPRLPRRITNDWFKPANLRQKLEARDRARWRGRSSTACSSSAATCDFATDVALYYPLHVIMSVLGVPESDEPRMLQLTQQLFGAEDPDFGGGDREADDGRGAHGLRDVLQPMTADRRARPTERHRLDDRQRARSTASRSATCRRSATTSSSRPPATTRRRARSPAASRRSSGTPISSARCGRPARSSTTPSTR